MKCALLDRSEDDVACVIPRIVVDGARFILVRQPDALGLGHAILVKEAAASAWGETLLARAINTYGSQHQSRAETPTGPPYD